MPRQGCPCYSVSSLAQVRQGLFIPLYLHNSWVWTSAELPGYPAPAKVQNNPFTKAVNSQPSNMQVFNQGVLTYERVHTDFMLDTPSSLGVDCGSPGTMKYPRVELRGTEEMHTPLLTPFTPRVVQNAHSCKGKKLKKIRNDDVNSVVGTEP